MATFTVLITAGAASAQTGYGETPPGNPNAGQIVLISVPSGETEFTFDQAIDPGDAIRFRAGGFGPETGVDILLQSKTVKLASTTADRGGFIDVDVTVPKDTSDGEHHLVASGVDPGGKAYKVTVTFIVGKGSLSKGASSAFPIGISVAALVALLIVAAVVTRKRRGARTEEVRIPTGMR